MPTRLSNLIRKASRGTLTNFILGAPKEYGQPLPTAADVQGFITPQRMREIVVKTPTAAACLNAILDYVTNVPILARNIDPAIRADAARVRLVEDFLRSPNPQDTGKQFLTKVYRDLATLGFASVEIEPAANGKPANLWTLDAARLRLDYDEHGSILGYDMLDAHGRPITGKDHVHGWLPNEVIYFARDPISSSLYPTSRISQLFTVAVLEDLMIYFISQRFTDSNIPFGIYDLGDITETELQYAVDKWNSQGQSGHRIMLTGSKSGGRWTAFGYHLRDLEAKELLNQVKERCMSILGVTVNELGSSEDVNKSNGYNLSFTFKKRAIEPLLQEVCSTLTKRLLWDSLGFRDMELYFEEIDSRDELLQAQIDTDNIKSGVVSINQVRNRRGDPSIPGGDVCYVSAGSSWLPVSLLEPFAKAQLQALQVVDQGASGSISPPQTRPPAEPIRTDTPDGRGGGSVRIKYANGNPSEVRGTTQAMRTQGLRKEDL